MRDVRKVWTKKVDAHYKRLVKDLRVEGLWAWRVVAGHLIEAGVPMQSGTVPVERFWNYLKTILPAGARKMSLEWFTVLMSVVFLRYNHNHFSKGACPTWARRDSLLAHHLEVLVGLSIDLTDATEAQHLEHVFNAFV